MTVECKLETLSGPLDTHLMSVQKTEGRKREREAKAERLHRAPTFTKQPGQTFPEAELSRDVQLDQSGESLFL